MLKKRKLRWADLYIGVSFLGSIVIAILVGDVVSKVASVVGLEQYATYLGRIAGVYVWWMCSLLIMIVIFLYEHKN